MQYDDFEFRRLSSPGFNTYFYPPNGEAAADSVLLLERWKARLESLFDHDLLPRVPVVLYGSSTDFAQTNVVPGLIPAGVGGVTEARQGRIAMPLSGVYGELDHVLGHELVHAFHFDLLGRSAEAASIPLWFVEGMAEYVTLGRVHPQTAMWLRDQAIAGDLPTVRQISRNLSYSPYRYGHSLWAYIGWRYTDRAAFDLYKEVLRSGLAYALDDVLGITVDELTDGWHTALERTVLRELPDAHAPDSEALDLGADVVVSPVLSPDGRYAAVFSRNELFSLDLYLVDIENETIVRRLARNRTSPHFDALRFIDSAGAFSPDGNRFAFVVERQGDNAVSIVSVADGRIERTIALRRLEAISSLAWSPDGAELALSATRGGITDLYLLDLVTERVDRLTDDPFAELHPAFSPDGTRIAFTTDRAGANAAFELETVGKTPARIGIVDREAGKTRVISIHPQATHTNPSFSASGEEVVFVADPDGIANVYATDLTGGSVWKLTDIATGVSGFTSLSPSLSVAAESETVAFTVYQNGDFRLHVLDSPRTAAKRVTPSNLRFEDGAALIPGDAGMRDRVVADSAFPVSRGEITEGAYRPRLRLSSVGQALVGVTASTFGTSVFASLSATFEDILSNHTVIATGQVTGGVRDLGGSVLYVNRTSRLEWGISGEHRASSITQSVAGGTEIETPEGPLTVADPAIVSVRTFSDRAGLLLQWPFSPTVRVEAHSGYIRIADELEIREQSFDQSRPEATYIFPIGDPIHLWDNELAFVLDSSRSGFTGPLSGSRVRVGTSPIVGSLDFVSVRVDLRQYFYMRPIGVAMRAVHLGRYLGDADSQLLSPLSIGDPGLVRGYDPATVRSTECSSEDCPEYDRLFGTKLAAANLEVRLPVFGAEGLGLVSFPYLPITVVAFADAGIAWSDWVAPELTLDAIPGVPTPVVSTGFSARFNLLDAVILELYYAWPFARSRVPSILGLTLQPGF